MDNLFSVKGKKVFITGSSGGVGSALVKGFRRSGAIVLEFDVFQKDIIPKELNVLINCAGISAPGSGQETMDSNFWLAYEMSFEVIKRMKERGGSIINITSLGAELGFPDGNPIYQASKAALRQLTKYIAVEYGKYGIRANNVCPGYILTPMTQKSWDDPEKRKVRTDRTCLGRWGKPEDIVGACIFLASDASSYVTGSDIYVDGGWMAKGL